MGTNAAPGALEFPGEEPPTRTRSTVAIRFDVTPLPADELSGMVEHAAVGDRQVHLERKGGQTFLVVSAASGRS